MYRRVRLNSVSNWKQRHPYLGGCQMIEYKRFLLNSGIAFLLFVVPLHADSRPTNISKSGTTKLDAKFENQIVRITFHTRVFKVDDGCFPDGFEYFNTISLVQQINITVDGKTVFVPRSVFASLFDLKKASVISDKGNLVLTIDGGDGAESYSVRIWFNAKGVTRRSVFEYDHYRNPFEETRYRLASSDD